MSHLWVKQAAHYICHAFTQMTTLIGVYIFERLWVLVYLKQNKIIDFFFTNREKHIKMNRLSYVG